MDPTAPVLVTGASGYIASWIVRYLLEGGYTVRATVRNPDKAQGLEHLHRLSTQHPGHLTLHRADLLDQGSFAEAMAGCEVVMHTASPFLVGKIRDPQEQLIRPALGGTTNVLTSVEQMPTVKRVVLTSSVAALYGDNADMQGKSEFGETDWNTTSTPDHQPYNYSKTVAERQARTIHDAQDRWDLVSIHPAVVLGPSLTDVSISGSMTTMRHFTDGSLTLGAPALIFGVVDVRDVARAHIAAAFTSLASGRYIATADTLSLLEIGTILRQEFGDRRSFPRRELPKYVVKLAAPATGMSRKVIDRNLGWPLAFDNSRTRTELGIEFRPASQSVIEMFHQMNQKK
ncbi:MAG: diaminohydroxyphosphoribosylaminopyrimidine deaminase [Gordonia sp. (in: high G+C Gram-positive bacteria)]|nr:MAG: diaminohydroxyphosphoribosylaminopyrimidine deaminase [Gordonia sp. (in: high G+C Gram-positive bacteria)]